MGQFTDTVHDILKDGTHEEVDMVRKLLLNQVEEMTELEREAGVCLRKLQDQRSCEVLHQADEKPWKGWYLYKDSQPLLSALLDQVYIVLHM